MNVFDACAWLSDYPAGHVADPEVTADAVAVVLARVAELEAVTEWGSKWSDGGYCPANPPRDEEFARRHTRMFGTRPIRRHVGPWVFDDTGKPVW